jgi:murein DD-endopeptidase MepM/ murein hydrolase activator NlpD
MASFTIDMSSPMPSGCTGTNGGPHSGGHKDPDPTHWYNTFGMDFSATVGTQVFAAFDAHVTRFNPHDKSKDTAKSYGAQIFARSPNDLMGVFYQHITNVPASIIAGASFSRGDLLGEVYIIPGSGMPPHLHWALVEIVGTRHVGVDLFSKMFDMRNTSTITTVTFYQDGTPPTAP